MGSERMEILAGNSNLETFTLGEAIFEKGEQNRNRTAADELVEELDQFLSL